MTALILSVLLMSWQSGEAPRQVLNSQITEGIPITFSDTEIALIASGVNDTAELENYAAKYEALIEGMMPQGRQANQKGKRLANILMKNVFKYTVSADENSADLRELIDDRIYGPLTATYVLHDLAARNELELAGLIQDERLANYFFAEKRGGLREVAAAMATQYGLSLPDDLAETIPDMLSLSKMLAPESQFGIGIQDVQLYNRALKSYNEEQFMTAARVAVGGATRYPNRTEFVNLCYNIGIQLFQKAAANGYPITIQLGESLSPFTGEHKAGFDQTIAVVRYNYAAQLFNSQRWEDALAMLEKADKEQDGYTTILAGSLSQLIEAKVEANDYETARAMLPDLMDADGEQGRLIERFIADRELQALESRGNLDEALAKAAENLGDARGRDNYIAVLTQKVQREREKEGSSLDGILSFLDGAPAAIQGDSRLSDIRFNTYMHWLKQYEDNQYGQMLPLFRRIFADDAVALTAEDRSVLEEGYGNALYYEIEYLIEERKFLDADAKSKRAVKLLPNHKALSQQRKKVDTILERIQ
jgi:hypothetical protein